MENLSKKLIDFCKTWAVNVTPEIISKVAELCKEYGIITPAEEMYMHGMHELFDDGIFNENYAKYLLEKGKKLGVFGNPDKEITWATHIGD